MKLRLSHTFLLLWSQGRYNDALNAYYHRTTVKTKALTDGIAFHKKWEKEILSEGKLSMGRTVLKFKNPKCEWKNIVPYNEQFDLSGTFDCIDDGGIYEWKSGVMGSLEYAQSYQLGIYFVMAEIMGLTVDRGILAHFNQHTGKADISIVWNTEREREKSRNFIDSLAPEIHQYFIENHLSFEK